MSSSNHNLNSVEILVERTKNSINIFYINPSYFEEISLQWTGISGNLVIKLKLVFVFSSDIFFPLSDLYINKRAVIYVMHIIYQWHFNYEKCTFC